MIHDLSGSDQVQLERATDICVVGAGTAGLFLAHLLFKRGLRVLVIEAGGATSLSPREHGIECSQRGTTYRGAEAGRNFGLGGTSATWGGQLIRPVPSDLEERPEVNSDGWPQESKQLDRYYEQVREELGLPKNLSQEPSEDTFDRSRYSELRELSPDFRLRVSEWLPFMARNFSQFFQHEINSERGMEVWLNAPVVSMQRDSDSNSARIEKVIARNKGGKTLIISAKSVVLCAGALESTRILLEFDESSDGTITREGAPLGRYFADHLSVSAGRFQCLNWSRYNKMTAPIFVSGIMRSPRLELTREAQKRERLPSAFGHFTFVTHGDTGFDVVRSWLRKNQGKDEKLVLPYKRLAHIVSDLCSLMYWRWYHRQLWISRQAELLLQVDIEQTPNWTSRVFLDEKRDASGRKTLAIDWRIREDDVQVVRKVTELIGDAWRSSRFRSVAELTLAPPQNLESVESLYDVYHPTGTIRMGSSPRDSVVDKDLRLWAAENVHVVSTAVFPVAGSANPTFAELALAARLADHLATKTVGTPIPETIKVKRWTPSSESQGEVEIT